MPGVRACCVAAALAGAMGLLPDEGGLAAQSRSAPSAPPPRWGAFTAAFDRYAQGDGVVGGSVVVLRDGRVLARHAWGRGDMRVARPPEEDAVYHWASITKTLTAIAVLQLRDRGRLTLDDPIVRYVPELRQVHDAYGPIDDVTLRTLLSHSAGFQNPTWPYGEGRSWEPFEPTRWEQAARPAANPLEFDPGITIPNGGWNAPVADLLKYLAFLTHADHADSAVAARYDAVLRHATLEEMWRPVVPLTAGGSLDEAFGLSFYLSRRGDRTIVGHTGEQSGFRSFFYLDPVSTVAVVGVLNATNEARPEASAAGWDALTRAAVDLVAP